MQRSDETEIITTRMHPPSRAVTCLLISLALVAGTALVILVGFAPL